MQTGMYSQQRSQRTRQPKCLRLELVVLRSRMPTVGPEAAYGDAGLHLFPLADKEQARTQYLLSALI